MAYQLGLDDAVAVREPHQAGRELRRRARPVVRPRALGGAGRLLAVDDRRRDRRPRRRGRDREAQPRRRVGRTVWLGVADDYQRSIKGWTVTTNGPSRAALLHPPLEDGRSERGDLVQRRQRRADARPARRDRRRLPRARAARRAARRRPGRPRVAAGRRLDDRDRHGERRPAGTATTATATATARTTVIRGRRRTRAPATSGRCCRPSAPSRISRRSDKEGAAALLLGMKRFASGVGLIPEQDWEFAGPRAVAVRHRSDGRVDRLPERRARRARRRR